jgi:hypothetical protein
MLDKSIDKTPCENYLFSDYLPLKSGISTRTPDLITSLEEEVLLRLGGQNRISFFDGRETISEK